MTRSFRSGIVATALFCAAASGLSNPAEARSSFHFSANIGIPLYPGYFSPGWYGRPAYYPPRHYNGYYPRPYYSSSYYASPYYPAPYYSRPNYRGHMGAVPTYGLGLFPAPVGTVLTPDDRAIYSTAARRALDAPVGQAMAWNSGTANGTVTTTRDGWAGQRYCREFLQEITVGGRHQQAYGTACQTPGGDWQIVPNQ